MYESFLFVGLPYLALVLVIVVSVVRYRKSRFSYSALSSQFLEDRVLLWGTVPWHIGILTIALGHLIPFLIPGIWESLTANRFFLYTVEIIGMAAAFLALAGLAILIYRRLTQRTVQSTTTTLDLVVLVLLGVQVLTGLGVALGYRWGAAWAPGTVVPYVWSVLTLRPEVGYVNEMPGLIKLHIVGAWVILALLPFSRLVHLFSIPFAYLVRPPQRVVWSNPRRQHETQVVEAQERRSFLKGSVGVGSAAALLSVGFLDKVVRYFRGPELTEAEATELVETRLKRLELTAEEKRLELERMRKQVIPVANLADLDPKQGKYFIDYQMRPALAFRDASGFPLLISAKCTHLGCTVGATVDDKNRVLCPCHVSYFDIRTGEPNEGAPAKTPLPRLGWILMDGAGTVLASQGPDGVRHGEVTVEQLATARVYIAKKYEERTA